MQLSDAPKTCTVCSYDSVGLKMIKYLFTHILRGHCSFPILDLHNQCNNLKVRAHVDLKIKFIYRSLDYKNVIVFQISAKKYLQ